MRTYWETILPFQYECDHWDTDKVTKTGMNGLSSDEVVIMQFERPCFHNVLENAPVNLAF